MAIWRRRRQDAVLGELANLISLNCLSIEFLSDFNELSVRQRSPKRCTCSSSAEIFWHLGTDEIMSYNNHLSVYPSTTFVAGVP